MTHRRGLPARTWPAAPPRARAMLSSQHGRAWQQGPPLTHSKVAVAAEVIKAVGAQVEAHEAHMAAVHSLQAQPLVADLEVGLRDQILGGLQHLGPRGERPAAAVSGVAALAAASRRAAAARRGSTGAWRRPRAALCARDRCPAAARRWHGRQEAPGAARIAHLLQELSLHQPCLKHGGRLAITLLAARQRLREARGAAAAACPSDSRRLALSV